MSAFRVVTVAFALAVSGAASVAGAAEPRTSGKALHPPPPAQYPSEPELLYAPLKSCRIASTSGSTAGAFAANTTRTFTVRGTANFPAQGGKSGGCGVPTYATAVAVSTTVTSYSQGGFMMAKDAAGAGSTRFTAYGPNEVTTTTSIFPLAAAEPSISLYASAGGNTHLFVDVVGYYIPPIAGMINASGGIYAGTSRLISATKNGTGAYTVKVDRDVSYCTVTTQAYSYGNEAHAYMFNISNISVYTFTRSGATVVAADDYVYVHVAC